MVEIANLITLYRSNKDLSESIFIAGICCGNQACFTRTMAETLGRKPEASRFSKDMSKHITVLRDSEGREATYKFMSKLVVE